MSQTLKSAAIIGSGLSGLVSAWYLQHFNPDLKISLFGTDHKTGQIMTDTHEETLLEKGPAYLLLENPVLHFIVSQIAESLIHVDEKFSLIKDKYYQKAPSGFMDFENGRLSFVSGGISSLFSMNKKMAPWETLSFFDFLKSTHGQTYAETLGSIFSRNNFFSEAEDVNLQAALPDIYNQLMQGLSIKESIQAIQKEDKNFIDSEFGDKLDKNFKPGFYYYKEGLESLLTLIREDMKKKGMHFEVSRISEITENKGQFYLHTKKSKYGPFSQIIAATSARDQAPLWRVDHKELSQKLNELKYRSVSYVYSAYRFKNFNRSGLGFFAPRKEKLTISGAFYMNPSLKALEQKDIFLTRTVLPGNLSVFSDNDLVEMQTQDFEKIFSLKMPPLWSKVYRHEFAAPVLDDLYTPWLKQVREATAAFPNIAITGKDFNRGDLSAVLKEAYLTAHQMAGASEMQ